MDETANYSNKNKEIKEYRTMIDTCKACKHVLCEHVGNYPPTFSVGRNVVYLFVHKSPEILLFRVGGQI